MFSLGDDFSHLLVLEPIESVFEVNKKETAPDMFNVYEQGNLQPEDI